MASARDRWTWVALAFVLGLVLGGVILLPPPEGGTLRSGVPSSPVPAQAAVDNAGTEDVRAVIEARDGQGRVVHRYDLVVEGGLRQIIPVDLPDGAFLFVGLFRLDDRASGTTRGDFYVEVGGCGAERTSGVLFRVAGTRSGVRLDGMEETCS